MGAFCLKAVSQIIYGEKNIFHPTKVQKTSNKFSTFVGLFKEPSFYNIMGNYAIAIHGGAGRLMAGALTPEQEKAYLD